MHGNVSFVLSYIGFMHTFLIQFDNFVGDFCGLYSWTLMEIVKRNC